MVNSIKKAKLLKEQGVSVKDIELQVGISRNYIPKLLELYNEMSEMQQVDDKNSEYVRIKKKRYMLKSIKLQHRMADMRKQYIESMQVLTSKRKKIRKYLDEAEEISDLLSELKQKQLMLNVTSSNLQHAEDGYEYLKQEWNYNKIIYFLGGVLFSFAVVTILSKFFVKVSVVY